MTIPINEDDLGSITQPEAHYLSGMELLRMGVNIEDPNLRIAILLESIAHALLGGLRDGLDYAARQANKPEPGSPISPGPLFEEDEDRP
jgi:hypothetical protein